MNEGQQGLSPLHTAVIQAVRGQCNVIDSEAHLLFRLEEDFAGFAGHFPGRPLLPAFLQVLMARHVLETWHGAPLRLLEVDRAKFKLPVGPGEVMVRCRKLEAGHLAQLETREELASSFLLHTAPLHEAAP